MYLVLKLFHNSFKESIFVSIFKELDQTYPYLNKIGNDDFCGANLKDTFTVHLGIDLT